MWLRTQALSLRLGCCVYTLPLPIHQAFTMCAPINRRDLGHRMSLSAARATTGRPLSLEKIKEPTNQSSQRCRDNVSLATVLNSLTHLNGFFKAPQRGMWRGRGQFFAPSVAGHELSLAHHTSDPEPQDILLPPSLPPLTSSQQVMVLRLPSATSPAAPLSTKAEWSGCAESNRQLVSSHRRASAPWLPRFRGAGLCVSVTLAWTVGRAWGHVWEQFH